MEKLIGMDEPQIHFEGCNTCGGAYFDAGEFESYVKAGMGA
jgi:Zn-finger nucleic acid-binding protein